MRQSPAPHQPPRSGWAASSSGLRPVRVVGSVQGRPGRCVGVIGGNEQVRGASRLMPFERGSPDKNHSWDLMRSSWPGSSDPCQTAASAQRPERHPRSGQSIARDRYPLGSVSHPAAPTPQSSIPAGRCTASCTYGSGSWTAKGLGACRKAAGSESVLATKSGERKKSKRQLKKRKERKQQPKGR